MVSSLMGVEVAVGFAMVTGVPCNILSGFLDESFFGGGINFFCLGGMDVIGLCTDRLSLKSILVEGRQKKIQEKEILETTAKLQSRTFLSIIQWQSVNTQFEEKDMSFYFTLKNSKKLLAMEI